MILIILGFSKQDNSLPLNCGDDIICTESKSITIQITDNNQAPVELDHFYTFNKYNGQIYQFKSQPTKGIYTVLSDAKFKDVLQAGSAIIFIGILNGEKVNQQFIIGHNCCNIVKIAGENKIVFPTVE